MFRTVILFIARQTDVVAYMSQMQLSPLVPFSWDVSQRKLISSDTSIACEGYFTALRGLVAWKCANL